MASVELRDVDSGTYTVHDNVEVLCLRGGTVFGSLCSLVIEFVPCEDLAQKPFTGMLQFLACDQGKIAGRIYSDADEMPEFEILVRMFSVVNGDFVEYTLKSVKLCNTQGKRVKFGDRISMSNYTSSGMKMSATGVLEELAEPEESKT